MQMVFHARQIHGRLFGFKGAGFAMDDDRTVAGDAPEDLHERFRGRVLATAFGEQVMADGTGPEWNMR